MSDMVCLNKAVIKNNTGLDAITRAPIVNYETDHRCLRIQNVSHNEDYEEWGYTEVSDSNFKNFQLKKDSIIISRTGGSIGTLLYIDKDYDAVYNNGLINLCIDEENFDPKYIYYCLKLDAFKKHIDKCSLGNSTQENIRMNDMLEYKIPYYTLDVQRHISKVLICIDNKIKNNNKINTELESMVKTLYDYWFLQFEFPNEEGKPYKLSGGKMVWNEELKREIPEGWEVDILDKHIQLKKGISYTSKNIESGVGTPMINLASVDIKRNYKPNDLKYFNGDYNTEKEIRFGDMLIACTDLTRNADIIGSPILVPNDKEKYIYSMDLAKMDVLDDKFNPLYLYMTLRTEHYHNYIKGYASGTNVLHLNTDGISWFKTWIPKKEIQDKFAVLIERFHAKKSEIIRENQELESLRNFLLPLLMNGQVGFEM